MSEREHSQTAPLNSRGIFLKNDQGVPNTYLYYRLSIADLKASNTCHFSQFLAAFCSNSLILASL